MTTFSERERAFEAKYAFDEEFRFRVAARRDKVFAHWAAEQLHLSEHDRDDLTNQVLAIDDGAGHEERLLKLIRHNFILRGAKDPSDLRTALYQCAEQARLELIDHHPGALTL
ncbi:MAG: ATPase inhibitor subunit zeta [Acetobacteraceae bacterium]|nr:ATPase inhibitor subunit zeta [Acetobacteraceae bacterium]